MEHRHLPNVDRLSIILAMILLAYALTSLISSPSQDINLQLPGFLLVINLNFNTLVSAIVAILAAAGADWLISNHPQISDQRRWHHLLVPAFTAIAIGVPLASLQVSPSWWAIFAVGGLLLTGVLVAEYISVDPSDPRYAIAITSLTAVTYALLLILIIAVTGAGMRLYTLLVAIVPAVFLVSARTLYLRLGGQWNLVWAGGITLIIAQTAAALFYLPLSALQLSLLLLGFTYGLVTLAANIEDQVSPQTMWIEPALMTLVFSVSGFLVR